MQGRIACCNVLSDLFSMGVTDIDTVLMVLAVSNKMNAQQKEIVTSLMIQGFDECAQQVGAYVLGGQTIINPWPIIGGVGISVVEREEFLMPNNAKVGDMIILTKPLGTQLAVNLKQWYTKDIKDKLEKIQGFISKEQVDQAFLKAEMEMGTLSILPSFQ
ncbi:selenophosphate synthetase 2, putative [Ichthyophthirius multifiliis]|uniref:Selenophosphate synthetase 2, putative n=1 Tax=Ichthyophthirius multifiliis TaxID=5932 RepID=G0R3A5_ICHMU|nr:selenophosphate synthetase 2, putative [Ichthyophthirius multifiliis]EGR28048.1 selenophosphate synthetase 2, putative [Ichthyophthirius multifiliis]|eukprot:XP_004027393.1 selenophosphate synthetase 2, putative [Ichthyophthirius multifiliis]